ncbi:hypothetical protein QBC42DRAFT_286353 [Cladorrhinum samala]|uniref:Uncharacterized protein n=1 Tax=Cladorrhinum samala TaxID=585594 RepID=A0AAV9HNX6_9PEZI|nr:hypothetical protein QBC42DRAFT_286353 [Cladorrhinum samala]
MSSSSRNVAVRRAIVGLFEPGGVVSERDARRVVNRALEATVDGLEGIGPDEDIVDFLGRAAQFSNLGRALEEDVWVELVYQIVLAREKYMREASDEEKKGNQDRMTAMAWRAEELLQEAGDH